jgi:hypothetical protein
VAGPYRHRLLRLRVTRTYLGALAAVGDGRAEGAGGRARPRRRGYGVRRHCWVADGCLVGEWTVATVEKWGRGSRRSLVEEVVVKGGAHGGHPAAHPGVHGEAVLLELPQLLLVAHPLAAIGLFPVLVLARPIDGCAHA